jgi:hypothetical protein
MSKKTPRRRNDAGPATRLGWGAKMARHVA